MKKLNTVLVMWVVTIKNDCRNWRNTLLPSYSLHFGCLYVCGCKLHALRSSEIPWLV